MKVKTKPKARSLYAGKEYIVMSEERRRALAALSFSDKIKILEKLRIRSLVLAEAREKLAKKRKQIQKDTIPDKCHEKA